ncbi:MAG TPA: trypsin-like peptidase domain-containing protein [Acidimicrobiia bacterium]|jgi:serine protease Do|nr:trypsin-like peptidase domain-containing protein [Acidimicrobiia bacterium]
MRRLGTLLAALAFVVAACSGDSMAETTTTLAPPPTEPPLQPQAWAEDHLVNVRSEGDFAGSPIAGSGTGLVVDANGLIVAPATAVVGATRVNVDIAGVEFPVQATVEAVAECPNLALLQVDHTFAAPPSLSGSEPTFAAWVEGGAWQIADASRIPTTAGAVMVDTEGAVVSMELARPRATPTAEVDQLTAAMRRREITSQLGYAVVDADGGGVLVTSVATGSELRPRDTISAVNNAPLEGVAALCADPPSNGTSIEVVRDGSRWEGVIGVEVLHPASHRSTEELAEAVVRIDVDVDGDGVPDPNGTGFFISSDGYVVTNHHVVSGNTDVRITWDGADRFVDGRVIGRSSCADLAVIDVDGNGFEYLEWSQTPIALEQRVRSIGFPAGTDQLTIQPGAVSKDTVDPFIISPIVPLFEHSAQIIGGNSGGPVVNEDGEVVGVTNISRELGAAQERLAIVGEEAAPVVQRLLGGDVDHLGAQLYPIFLGPGVGWIVESVDVDSIAGDVDLRRGDFIQRLGPYDSTGEDWTVEVICRTVLGTSDAIPIEISRGFPEERWDGELRGRPLELLPEPFFASSPDGVVATLLPGRWVGYEPIAPDENSDFRGFRAGLSGFDWANQFGREPYMRVLASLQLAEDRTTEEQLAGETYDGICATREVEPTLDGDFVGHRQSWSDCSHGVDIISYAWLDTSQSPSPMVLLLVVDEPSSLLETVDQAIAGLFVARFPPPAPPEEDSGGGG